MKLASFLLLALALQARAQYQITSWTMDGGGGQSISRFYTVTGTLGQPDAGVVRSGGAYALMGGFWSFAFTVQSEGAPALRIIDHSTRVTLAWPDPSKDFQLQVSPSLAQPDWTDVKETPDIVGAEKQVTLPKEPGTWFFRLIRP